MTNQPEALRLADELTFCISTLSIPAVNELRRLHEVNAELVEALKQMVSITEMHQNWTENRFAWAEIDLAKEALAKAGESNA